MGITLRGSSHIANGVKNCGGNIDMSDNGIIRTTTPLNYLFDKVLKNENIEGSVEYRLIYLSNDPGSHEKVYAPKVKLISTPNDTISLGPLMKNQTGMSLQTERSLPSSVVFKTQDELDLQGGGYLAFTGTQELAAGEFVGLWLKREVQSTSGSGTVKEEFVLEVQYRS